MNKILVVSTINVLEDPRIFYKIILSLKKVYNDVTYMVKSEKKEPFIEDAVKIVPIPIVRSILKRFFYQHWVIFYKILKGKYDIVQFNNPEFIFCAFVLKIFFRKKIVFDVHENFSRSFINKKWIPLLVRKTISFTYPKLEKTIINYFDCIIIAETSYREHYGSRAIEILNYPILNKNKFTERSFKEVVNFVYVGGIMEDRRIWELVEIFKIINSKYPKTKLFLVGPFAPLDLEEEVKTKIFEYKLENRIEIFGRKSLPEVYEILNKSDFGFSLLKPIGNYYESLSTKIFDYMTFGIPFAVSNFPIYKKYVVEAKTGIVVDEEDIVATANNIMELIKDKEKLIEMSNNGKEQTELNWNWSSEENKLLNIYRSL